MVRRHDYEALKLEYIKGPWETVDEFRRFKGFATSDKNPTMSKMMKGWSQEKRALIALATKKASLTLLDDKADEIRKVRERQAKLGRYLQLKGAEAMRVMEPKNIEDARKLIMTGMEQERAALGISGGGGGQNLTQVNVNLPKTKFDDLIDGQDYEGILRIIADVRRERTRRLGNSSTEQSESKAE